MRRAVPAARRARCPVAGSVARRTRTSRPEPVPAAEYSCGMAIGRPYAAPITSVPPARLRQILARGVGTRVIAAGQLRLPSVLLPVNASASRNPDAVAFGSWSASDAASEVSCAMNATGVIPLRRGPLLQGPASEALYASLKIAVSPGGANETRTRDPLLAKQVLFQLSYSPSAAGAALSGYPWSRAGVVRPAPSWRTGEFRHGRPAPA
jgi:hypothetical protein